MSFYITVQRTYTVEFVGPDGGLVENANEYFDLNLAADDVEGATRAFIAHDHVDLKDGVTTYAIHLNGTVYVSYEDAPMQPVVTSCSCARHSDGSVTTSLCSTHADIDPCLTMSLVTGTRRKGTIRKGICSACGHCRS